MSKEPCYDEPSDQVKAALTSFRNHANIPTLNTGLRNFLLHYFMKEMDREVWVDAFLQELSILFAFLDQLEEDQYR